MLSISIALFIFGGGLYFSNSFSLSNTGLAEMLFLSIGFMFGLLYYRIFYLGSVVSLCRAPYGQFTGIEPDRTYSIVKLNAS